MKRIVKTLLLLFAIIIIAGTALAGYLYLNQQAIKNYFVGKVNEQLNAKISISEIDLELFSQFPKVSLDLNHVKITDPLTEEKLLLDAQHIFIGFNLYDVVSGNYNIKLITVDSGTCNLFIDKNGKTNFNIIKTDTSEKKGKNMFLELKQVKLKKVTFNYTDLQAKQHYKMLVNDVKLSGSFNDKRDDITCRGKIYVERFKTGSLNLIKEKSINADIILGINAKSETYTIKKGELEVDELKLEASGRIINKPEKVYTDIKFRAKQLSIQSLLSLLPMKVKTMNGFESSGNIYFNGTIKGDFGHKENAAINLEFGIEKGKLTRKSDQFKIENIICKGHFTNGAKRNAETSILQISGLSMKMKSGEISGDISLTNIDQPYIQSNLTGELDASQFIKFINNENIEDASGDVKFNVSLAGKLDDFTKKSTWNKTRTSGRFNLNMNHIKLKDSSKEVESLKAEFTLQQNDLLIEEFESKLEKSDVSIKGKLLNVVPFFLLEKQKLEAEIEYKSDYIDLEHFILPVGDNTHKETVLQLPGNISMNVKARIKKLVFHEFTSSNVNAQINWKGKKLTVDQVFCETMNGSITANGQIENADDGRFLITGTSTLKNININELFRQCNNFGQKELTNKHLYGVVNASVDLASVWSSKLDCDLTKLYAFGDLQILNGEIIDYKPLEGLSKYADVDDLRHLRFAELRNKIEIKNKTILIPSMDMKSNALNITLSGTHTFDNYLDYKLKLKLSELLKKKRKPQANEFGEEEDESGKGLFLYLTMKGPIDNLKFGYDKIGVKNKIKQDIKIEKENIKEILKKELGIGKDSTIREKQNDNDELEFEKE